MGRSQVILVVALGMLLLGGSQLCSQPVVSIAVNTVDSSSDIAPGALISIFGSGFSTINYPALSLPLPATLGGVSVQITSGAITTSAPLYFVSPSLINAQLPYGVQGSVGLTVTNAAGVSNAISVQVAPSAPKFFTLSGTGEGYVSATHGDGSSVARGSAATPGEAITLYLNSLGAVTPTIDAGVSPGDGSASRPFNRLVTTPTVLLDTLTCPVTFAGLVPGFPGLYQVNVTTPYDDKLGDASISVASGAGVSQAGVTIPVVANGLYWVVTGGKFANGQTFNGVPGTNSSLAFRHNSPTTFGSAGFNAWTKNTGLATSSSTIAGIALTLTNSNAIVFDNSGIETGAVGAYYSGAPGYNVFFAMSNLSSPTSASNTVQAAYAGYFRVNGAVTFDQLTGYFEGPVNVSPPFNPANIYNTFHMNVFSNVSGTPRETGSFKGDVFSSDSIAGTFSFSATGANRVTAGGAQIPIYRLVYTLKTPMTLPAGEYWFEHDISTPVAAGAAVASAGQDDPLPKAKRLRPTGLVKEWGRIYE